MTTLKDKKEYYKEKLNEVNIALKKKENYKISKKGKTKFYNFHQNNSGGHFVRNDDVCENVFIEAHSPEEANMLADNFGIYFDGCSTGEDCSCCGDRWYETTEGEDEPKLYGIPVKKCYVDGSFRTQCIIHYLNGTKEKINFKTSKDCPQHKWKQQYDIGLQCEICHVWKKELNKNGKK